MHDAIRQTRMLRVRRWCARWLRSWLVREDDARDRLVQLGSDEPSQNPTRITCGRFGSRVDEGRLLIERHHTGMEMGVCTFNPQKNTALSCTLRGEHAMEVKERRPSTLQQKRAGCWNNRLLVHGWDEKLTLRTSGSESHNQNYLVQHRLSNQFLVRSSTQCCRVKKGEPGALTPGSCTMGRGGRKKDARRTRNSINVQRTDKTNQTHSCAKCSIDIFRRPITGLLNGIRATVPHEAKFILHLYHRLLHRWSANVDSRASPLMFSLVTTPVGRVNYLMHRTLDGQQHVVHRELIKRTPQAVAP
jgi:hypothetical protein